MSGWTTIESDPGVFTSLVEQFGTKGAEFTELYALDDSCLPDHSYGLIFLFKWSASQYSGNSSGPAPLTGDELLNADPTLFFAKQVVQNACATQAILSILLNVENPSSTSLDLGPTLTDLRAFTQDFDPHLRGEMIGASDVVREAHNSFAKQDPFVSDEKKIATDDDDVFHFIAYVPHGNGVWELDGLKAGPVRLGDMPEGGEKKGWVDVARRRIQERIETYSASEIKFNLMSIVPDQRMAIQEGLAANPGDSGLQAALQMEELKRENWKIENDRRRHNYVPFVMELLKALAEAGKLGKCIANAEEKSKKRKAAKRN